MITLSSVQPLAFAPDAPSEEQMLLEQLEEKVPKLPFWKRGKESQAIVQRWKRVFILNSRGFYH